jgi:phage protein U
MRLECDVILHWSRQKRGKKADTHQATGVEPTSIALRWRGRPGTVVPGVTGRFMSMRWVASGRDGVVF